MINLTGGIVLYNPNIEVLKKSVNELKKSCQYIIFVDNNSENIKEIEKEFDDVLIIKNEDNFGIAKALNQLLDCSYRNKSEALLTLDQDSLLESNMIIEMTKYLDDDTAIVCPIINDLNKNNTTIQKQKILSIDRCITSGSLMNLNVCKKIGYFDEKMFIDYVDFDYCKRIKLSDKKIIRLKNAVIDHEIGKRTTRKFFIWNVYPTNHNKNRVYYISRNMKYYFHKYKKQMRFREKINEIIRFYWKPISILLYEDDKQEKISYFKKGIKDYKKMFN